MFPLRVVKSWLWLPLPIIGSIYPLSRQLGISNQDLSGKKYKAMRRAFEGVFQQYPPFVYASGHDHDLQVFRGGRRRSRAPSTSSLVVLEFWAMRVGCMRGRGPSSRAGRLGSCASMSPPTDAFASR